MRLAIGLMALLGAAAITVSQAQTVKKGSKPPVKSQDITKGQGQVQGGDGVFGTVYTLNSGWNFTLLKARYQVDPHDSYAGVRAKPDEKLLVLSVAIKNTDPSDKYFGGLEWQAVDEAGHDYASQDYRLSSIGSTSNSLNLKPGQGAGQFPDKDELAVAFEVPAKARISKLILKDGRKFVKGEAVVRYFIADVATKERDGQIGNPKNAIARLPDFVRDPADKLGAVALDQPVIKMGQAVPTGFYSVSVDSVTLSSTEKLKDQPPGEGKKFAIATFTAKNIFAKELGLFDLLATDEMVIRDSENDKYPADSTGARRATRDDSVADNLMIKPGESTTFRLFFEVPKDAKLKSLTFGQGNGRKYVTDLTGVK